MDTMRGVHTGGTVAESGGTEVVRTDTVHRVPTLLPGGTLPGGTPAP